MHGQHTEKVVLAVFWLLNGPERGTSVQAMCDSLSDPLENITGMLNRQVLHRNRRLVVILFVEMQRYGVQVI